MIRSFKKIAAVSFGMSAFSMLVTASNAAVVDFNAASPGTFLSAVYVEDGFRITTLAGHYDIFGPIAPGGTNFLNIDAAPTTGPVSTVRVDLFGSPFDLSSLEVVASIGAATLTTSAGGVANFPFGITGPRAFAGPMFSNLLFFDFSTTGPGIGIDTINVMPSASVSEPASILLVGLGLAGLAFLGSARARSRGLRDVALTSGTGSVA